MLHQLGRRTQYLSTNEGEGTVEHFSRGDLHNFLRQKWRQTEGVLQRFVEPKGIRNAVVCSIWSPKVCLLERRTNHLKIHDTRRPLHDRVITYEGPEHLSTTGECSVAPAIGGNQTC